MAFADNGKGYDNDVRTRLTGINTAEPPSLLYEKDKDCGNDGLPE